MDRADDPDETDGRNLYRASANSLAAAQSGIAGRQVTLRGHDPGGKTRLAMIAGVDGDAYFSECGRFRIWLSRDWGFRRHSDGREPYALWIGMNPSTAEAEIDDPTVRKEMGFTRRLGLDRYVKVNVMDYRATSPKALLAPGVQPCSDANRPAIRWLAERAATIIVCHGRLHKKLRRYGELVMADLRGKPLWCLGKNDDGSPKHPLYLAADTPLVPYS